MLVDIAAERGVLSGLAKYGSNLFLDINVIIDGDCFSKDLNKIIYKCFCKTFENSNSIDIPTLLSISNQLGFNQLFEAQQNLNFLKALFEFPILFENVAPLAKRLKKLNIARQCQTKLKETWEQIGEITGDESVDEIINLFESPILQLTNSLYSDADNCPKKLFDNIDEYLEYLANNPIVNMGLPTPWPLMNGALSGGIRPCSVTIIAGRTGTAKSHIGRQVAVFNAEQGNPTLLLDTELVDSKQIARTIANISRIPINEVETGQFGRNPEVRERVIRESKRLKNIPLDYLSVAGKPFSEILSILKRWVIKNVKRGDDGHYKTSLCVLDYMKLMGSDAGKDKEWLVLGNNITMLQDLCVKFNIACLTFVQANREALKSVEDLSIVSGSDRLSHLATNVCFIVIKNQEEINEDGIQNGNMKFISLKARDGTTLAFGDYINYHREGQFSNLKEIGLKSELKEDNEGFEANEGDPTEF